MFGLGTLDHLWPSQCAVTVTEVFATGSWPATHISLEAMAAMALSWAACRPGRSWVAFHRVPSQCRARLLFPLKPTAQTSSVAMAATANAMDAGAVRSGPGVSVQVLPS